MNQPKNTHFQATNWYNLIFQRLPETPYFCQRVNLPSIDLGAAEYHTQLITIPEPGDRIQYSTLNLEFKVDEKMLAWRNIFDWMVGLGFPEHSNQYKRLAQREDETTEKIIKSDANLIILNSNYNANMEILFVDCWPTNLGELSFDVTNADLEYLTCSATFRYSYYKVL